MSQTDNKKERHPLKEKIDTIIHAGKSIGKMYQEASEETADAYIETTKTITKKFTDTL
jgi:hydrogenase maturation factor